MCHGPKPQCYHQQSVEETLLYDSDSVLDLTVYFVGFFSFKTKCAYMKCEDADVCERVIGKKKSVDTDEFFSLVA